MYYFPRLSAKSYLYHPLQGKPLVWCFVTCLRLTSCYRELQKVGVDYIEERETEL